MAAILYERVVVHMMTASYLRALAADVAAGVPVELSADDFPCFAAEALEGRAHVAPAALASISASLTPADACVFERAAQAIDEGDLAWIGFKVVYDAAAAVANTDNEVTKKYGDVGSANGDSFAFFCNDAKEIVCGREYSPRDTFQMKDATRGPAMHTEQFEGLTWLSVPLFDKIRVWLLGASDASAEVAALAHHVGFDVVVVDYDPAYISEDRFPNARRVLLGGGNFDELAGIKPSSADYACVLTRGHMFDPEACVWAIGNNLHYIGMMGCKGKNDIVHNLVLSKGGTEEGWQRIKRPIGLKFGAKTPAELAIAIVAELVDVRYRQNYSEAARAKHETSLGR